MTHQEEQQTANTTGAGGTLYMIEITNGAAYSVYFKLADSATAKAGTTAADIVVECAASSTRSYVIPGGVVFATGFSHWCVREAAEAGTTSPAGVTVLYVTS